jgi:hypothetical protein
LIQLEILRSHPIFLKFTPILFMNITACNYHCYILTLYVEMFEKIMNYLKQWEQDTNVHCVVVIGVGKKAFCAGN